MHDQCTTNAQALHVQCASRLRDRLIMGRANAWTGRTACALQTAMRLSNELFAERLGIGSRTVAAWHQKPDLTPQSEMQHRLDTALERAPDAVKDRFAELVGGSVEPTKPDRAAADAEQRLIADPHIGSALEWLDTSAGWKPGTSRRKVASHMAMLDLRDLLDRGHRRGRVDQRHIAQSVNTYYQDRAAGFGTYSARYDSDREVVTSILTSPDWLDLGGSLTPETDRLTLTSAMVDRVVLDELAAMEAVGRLAETLTADIRVIEAPLYRLLEVDIRHGVLAGTVGLTSFAEYALTMDLLEGELVDAITDGRSPGPGSLPLRDRYLPDLATVLDTANRLCCGGALALCAIARPATFRRGADYVLLVQERSGRVLNAARRLAVIPKGFHQPVVDYRDDAQIRLTLIREMEEELFGREDVDNPAEQRSADPLHPSRLSEPMRWLADQDRLRIECTGFGLNLVSGNCEFACLTIIDNEEFWPQFGGQISTNWEAGNLRQYSSLDRDLITELVGDVAWSNEGLFALLQGLRRLAETGGDRVNLPTIEWEIR